MAGSLDGEDAGLPIRGRVVFMGRVAFCCLTLLAWLATQAAAASLRVQTWSLGMPAGIHASFDCFENLRSTRGRARRARERGGREGGR